MKKYNKKNNSIHTLGLGRLGTNIVLTLGRQLFSILIGLGSSILIARTLGPQGNGQYTIAILLSTLLSSFLNLGIAPANVYFISRGDISVKSAFDASLRLWLRLTIVGIFAASVIILFYSETWFPGIPRTLLWFSLIAFPLVLLNSYLFSLLQGVQDFNRYNIITLTTPITNLVVAIIFIWWLKWDILGALIAINIAHTTGLLMSIVVLKPYITQSSNNNIKTYIKKSINYGWKAHLSNIVTFINYRVDIFFVNLFLNPSSVGIYVVAVQIVERLWILSTAVSTVLLPRISELHEDEHIRRLLTPLIARWIAIMTFITAIILAVIGKFLINFLFGKSFLEAYSSLIYLLPGVVFFSFARILANDIAARGQPSLNLYSSLIVVTVNIIINIILVPNFGMEGAAISTTLAYLIQTIVTLYFYSQLIKVKLSEPFLLNQEDIELIKKILQKIRKNIKS